MQIIVKSIFLLHACIKWFPPILAQSPSPVKTITLIPAEFNFLIDILALDKIVIGSIFQRCEDLLRPAMEKVIKKEVLCQNLDCEIVPAELGDNIGDYAALAVAKIGKE